MKLAVTLGFAPHQIRQWPNEDIVALMAYDHLEPFGSIRDNWHTAIQMQLMAAVHTPRGKAVPSASEFLYELPEEKVERNAKTFLALLKSKVKSPEN